jgi:hypothetical protein
VTGILLLLLAGAMALRPSRADRREVLGRYSREYAFTIVAAALAGAWWAAGLARPGSPRSVRSGRSFRAAVKVAGVTAVTFAAGEVVCRLAERPLSRFIGGPALTRLYSSMVTLNARGLRDPERPLAKPAGTWRTVVLGDSYMFGQGVAQDSTCARHLERMLARPGGPRVEVVNTSHTGLNTANERAMLDTLGMRFEPDLVLLGYMLNDPEPHNLTFPQLLPGPMAAVLDESVFYQALRAIAHYTMVAAGARPGYAAYIQGLFDTTAADWRTHVEALRGISADCRAAGVPLVVAVWPLPDRAHGFQPYRFVREQEAAVREAFASGAEVVDLLAVFARDSYADFAVSDWDAHPNARAQRRAATAIAAHLEARGLAPGAPR